MRRRTRDFLLDIKNAEKFNLGQEGITRQGSGHEGARRLDARGDDGGAKGLLPSGRRLYAAVAAPQWAVEEYGADKWASGDVPLWCNGPYKLDKWEHDVIVEISANPGYWNAENLHLKKVY